MGTVLKFDAKKMNDFYLIIMLAYVAKLTWIAL
jgi:hypothetical protein